MNVLFVAHISSFYQLGVMYLSSILKFFGHKSRLVDINYRSIRNELKKGTYDTVAFSVPTIHYGRILPIIRKIKQEYNTILILLGGPHPTFVPSIIEESSIDGVCIGEGEYAFLELLNKYQAKKSIKDVKNWWIKEDGKIFRNSVRNLIDDLDQLPFPDYKLYKHDFPPDSRFKYVLTSRGCPYHCSYCSLPLYRELYQGKGKILRKRSVENVIEEISEISVISPTDYISFVDDLFPLTDREWLEDFARRYTKEIKIPFSCRIRADLIDLERTKLLKEAGCEYACLGIESGNEYIRNTIMKHNLSEEAIVRASEIINSQGIKLITFNIIGAPGSSLKNEMETIRLNIKCNPHGAGAFFFEPCPKIELTEKAIQMNLFDGNFLDLSYKWKFYRRKPMLIFHNRKEARQIENLHHLFTLCIKFPFLLPILPWLINLPLGWLYYFSFLKWGLIISSLFLSERYRSLNFYSKVKRLAYFLFHVI